MSAGKLCGMARGKVIQTGAVKRQDALQFLGVLRLQCGAGESLVTADSPWSPTMGLLFGVALRDSCAAAVWEGRQAVALAQMARQSGRDQWEIIHLVLAESRREASAESNLFSARLLALLDEICRLAGAKRKTGVVVRVPEESWLVPTFRRAGFAITMQEDTYVRSAPFSVTAPKLRGLRKQERGDAWSLYQLYLRTTPQIVRLAEGRTARDWQLRRSSSRLSLKATRWVVEDAEGLVGWLTETPGKSGELRIQLGVAPGNSDLARDLLATALEHAGEQGSSLIRSRVPAYATDVHRAFAVYGFTGSGCDLVLKRSLAIRARDLAQMQVRRGNARDRLPATQNRTLLERPSPSARQTAGAGDGIDSSVPMLDGS